jgi:hypothetical protein
MNRITYNIATKLIDKLVLKFHKVLPKTKTNQSIKSMAKLIIKT